MAWNIQQLAEDVEAIHGRAQKALLEPCLQSIDERRGFARYHHSESLRLLAVAPTDQPESVMVGWMFGHTPTAEHSLGWVRFHASAHITACVQSMHSVVDILAHAVYFGLGMNLLAETTIKPRALYATSLRDKLPEKLPKLALKQKLTDLIDNPGFTYLTALSNHSKHRSIVPMSFYFDLTGEDELPHGLKFGSFDYAGTTFPGRWVRPVLTTEYERQETLIHAIGNELNSIVASERS